MRKLRRDSLIISPSTTITDLTRSLNESFARLEERISQIDAIGQNPDMKGRVIKNLGNLKEVSGLADPTTATVQECAERINQILQALGGKIS